MERRPGRTVLAALAALSLAPAVAEVGAPADAQQVQQGAAAAVCGPADDLGRHLRDMVIHVATSTDPNVSQSRTRMKIPQVAASEVTMVADNRVCGKAGSAYVADITRNDGVKPSGQVYVVKVGTVYVVADRAQVFGEWILARTLSGTYEVLARFGF